MVPGSKGPRYLKVIFKYKLESKEGPSRYGVFFLDYMHKIHTGRPAILSKIDYDTHTN